MCVHACPACCTQTAGMRGHNMRAFPWACGMHTSVRNMRRAATARHAHMAMHARRALHLVPGVTPGASRRSAHQESCAQMLEHMSICPRGLERTHQRLSTKVCLGGRDVHDHAKCPGAQHDAQTSNARGREELSSASWPRCRCPIPGISKPSLGNFALKDGAPGHRPSPSKAPR
jgi:hypothetical protein